MRKLGMPTGGRRQERNTNTVEPERRDTDSFGLGAGLKSLEDNDSPRVVGNKSQIRYKSPGMEQPMRSNKVTTNKKATAPKQTNNKVKIATTTKSKGMNATDIKKKMHEKTENRLGVKLGPDPLIENSLEMERERLNKHQGNVKSKVNIPTKEKVNISKNNKVNIPMQVKETVPVNTIKEPPVKVKVQPLNVISQESANKQREPISTHKVVTEPKAVIEPRNKSVTEIKQREQKEKVISNPNRSSANRAHREKPIEHKSPKNKSGRFEVDDDVDDFNDNKKEKNKRSLIIGTCLVVSIALLCSGYYLFSKNKASNKAVNNTNTSSSDSQALQISSATKFVGIAEGSLKSDDIDRAKQAVDALKDGPEKTALLKRLDDVNKDVKSTAKTAKDEAEQQAKIAKEVESKVAETPPAQTETPQADTTPAQPKAETPATQPKQTAPATQTAPKKAETKPATSSGNTNTSKPPVQQPKATITDDNGNVTFAN